MRVIKAEKIRDVVAQLCIESNLILRKDVVKRLKLAYSLESNPRARDIFKAIIKNAEVAEFEKLAICQDTGLPCVFVEIGQDVLVKGDIKLAINKGVELGYKEGSLRNSVIIDPLNRGTAVFSPAIIHFDLVKGSKVKITVFPKGFGCENKTQLKMFKPTAEVREIKKFIIDVVKSAGPDACPPYVIGIGIGGTSDYASFMAKKALLRKIAGRHGHKPTADIAKLEREILDGINKLHIGPMGLGGRTSVLSVHINTYPTHIAGLPVAVNLSCHALRSATRQL